MAQDRMLWVWGVRQATEQMQVRVVPIGGAVATDELAARVREQVLTSVYRLGWAVASAPDAFDVLVVEALTVNPRTYKTPLVVKET